MVNGLGNPNNSYNWPVNLRGPDGLLPVNPGLILQTPPKSKRDQKAFGEIVEGQIVSEKGVTPKGSNSKQHGADNSDDAKAKNRLAYTSAYADSVRARVNEDIVARANMTDLNQPITQKQLQALNARLNSIDNKLNQLLGSKAANTEWGLGKASLVDNLHGNSEIDVA